MEKINFEPLGDRVVIKKPESGAKKQGNIMLTEVSERGKAVWGEVLAVGQGLYSQNAAIIPMNVKVGDMVLYKKDMIGDPIKVDDEEYIVFREQDLIMVKRA